MTKSITESIELSFIKLEIQYIKGTRNVTADFLSTLINAKLTDYDNNSQGQELGCTLFDELPHIENVDTIPQTAQILC